MRGRAAAALAVVVAVSGCGGSAARHPTRTTTQPGRPATAAQVLTLARLLDDDRERGGARFTAHLKIRGQPVTAVGRVDFPTGRGTALITPVDPALGKNRRFYWTRDAVLAQRRPGSHAYDRQTPDPQNDPVHAMVAFVNLLAARTIDNTVNIADQDPRFLGATQIDGRPADAYRYGRSGATTLWVDKKTGLLRRVRTTRVPGGLTIDLNSHGPQAIALPAAR
jgi:hypothetical protein